MVVGPEDSGKREIIQFLEGRREIKLIESIVYGSRTIYVPDSYLRSPGMKNILLQRNKMPIVSLCFYHLIVIIEFIRQILLKF